MSSSTGVSSGQPDGSPTEETWAVIAGGGTAGHVLPGLAVADELVARGHPVSSLHFVGAERGIESRLVPEAGYAITLLPGRGIERRLSLQNVAASFGLLAALWKAVVLMRRRRPAVVLALGGFASAACSLAALLWRVPLVVADQNARAGAANRLVGRFAAACAVPFEETDLPHAVVTGNPVRPEILAVAVARRDPAQRAAARSAARVHLGLPLERTVVVLFAGSLGSRRLNTAMYGAALQWADRDDLAIYHVVGSRDWDDRPAFARAERAELGGAAGPEATGERASGDSAAAERASDERLEEGHDGLWYRAIRYEDRMDLVMAAADLAVCRSGGTTVAELAAVGLASVLVPLPIATRDHQRANAAALVAVGGAVLVSDDELDERRLVHEVESIIGSGGSGGSGGDVLWTMGEAARSVGRLDSATAVADLIEAHARRPR